MNQQPTATLVETLNRILCTTSLKEALELARPIFGNPLILGSLAKTIIATTQEPELGDGRWLDLSRNQRVPLSCLYHQEIQDAYQQSQQSRRPVMDTLAEDGIAMLRKVLLVEDTPMGYLESPLYYGMPSAEQLEFFDLLGNYLAGRLREELNRPALPDNMLDYFAFDLLEGKVKNQELIAQRLGYFRWELMGKGLAQIISIRWLDREDQGSTGFRQLAETLIQQFRDCRVFVYGLEIKLVCALSEPVEMDAEFLGRLRDILKGYAVSAGVSRPVERLQDIADHNIQARKASEIGYMVEPEEQLHFFDDLSVYYALELACREHGPEQLIHYGLLTLRNYDGAHDTNLAESLEVYLKHNQSIGEAAAALFIHRNTMNYRVSKIVELTHLNLKNPKVVEQLMLSFSVLRFQAHWGPDYAPSGLAFQRSLEKTDATEHLR